MPRTGKRNSITRQAFAAYLTDTYNTEGEHLLAKHPGFLVFRHNLKLAKRYFNTVEEVFFFEEDTE